jgi:hypothetical protein
MTQKVTQKIITQVLIPVSPNPDDGDLILQMHSFQNKLKQINIIHKEQLDNPNYFQLVFILTLFVFCPPNYEHLFYPNDYYFRVLSLIG